MGRLNCCLLILALTACASFGCSSGKTTVSTEPVEGLVTLDGEPVAGARVTFQPVTKGQGLSATGMTDDSGVYKLTATPTGDEAAEPDGGTLPGEYYVGVEKTTFGGAEEHQEEGSEEAGGEDAGAGEVAGDDGATFVVPQKYNIPSTSGIKKTVNAGPNNIPIELTSE